MVDIDLRQGQIVQQAFRLENVTVMASFDIIESCDPECGLYSSLNDKMKDYA